MSLLDLIRTMNKAEWRTVHRMERKFGYAARPSDQYDDKLAIQESIQKHQKDGMVRISDRFMDCDHAVSTCTRLVPATIVHIIRFLDDIYNNAEGPGNAWIHFPDDTCDPDFRDLALEAFEDGHPHITSEVRFETH